MTLAVLVTSLVIVATPGTVAIYTIAAGLQRGRRARVIGQPILINVLNPKLTIFFFVFLPQFVHPSDPGAVRQMLVLSGVFMALTFVGWMRRAFASSYVVLAGRLALTER